MRRLLIFAMALIGAMALTVIALAGPPELDEDDLDDLEGTYGERITVKEDPGNHRDFILLDGEVIGVIEYEEPPDDDAVDSPITISGGLPIIGPIDISGPPPFVDVDGNILSDGSFFATGIGTVAGFPNVTVEMEGTVRFGSTGVMEADYTMGAGGELPGGQPITYHFESRQLVNGDVNCDGHIDGKDVIHIAMHQSGLSVTQTDPCPDFGDNLADLWEDVLPAVWADPNCDTTLNIPDLQAILEYLADLTPTQQAGCPGIGSPYLPVP